MAILLDNLFIVEKLVIIRDDINIYHMTWWRANISGLDHKAPVTATIELSDDYRLHEEIFPGYLLIVPTQFPMKFNFQLAST